MVRCVGGCWWLVVSLVMVPSRRHGVVLVVMVVSCGAAASTLHTFNAESDVNVLVVQTLSLLVSGPLRDHNLVLVTEDHGEDFLDVDRVLSAAESSLVPVSVTTQHSLLNTPPPQHHTKGTHITAIVLFYNDTTDFFLLLDDNENWNPSYLVLFCLNPNLDTTPILNLRTVQRSLFILLLQPSISTGGPELKAFTSLPNRDSGQGGQLSKVSLGFWNPVEFNSRQTIFPPRFLDFRGQRLVVTHLCYDTPYLYLDEDQICRGGNLDILRVIEGKHKFKYELYTHNSYYFGFKSNGTWYGIFVDLVEAKDLITINVLQPNPDRAGDFDYTYPHWNNYYAFLNIVPPPTPRWKSLLYPFSIITWFLVIASTVASAALLAGLLNKLSHVTDPIDIMLKVVSGLLGQSMNDKRVRDFPWARVWLIFWWLSVDVLAAAYLSNLMSVLTVPVYPKRIQTSEELLESDCIPCMLDYGSHVPQSLRTSSNPVLAEVGRKLEMDLIIILSDPWGYLMRKAQKGTHCPLVAIDYLLYDYSVKKMTETHYIMDDQLYANYMSLFLPKNTPYTPVLSHTMQRLRETGIVARIYENHRSSVTAKVIKGVRGTGVLSLDHLQGAFILLGLVGSVAAIVLLMERLV